MTDVKSMHWFAESAPGGSALELDGRTIAEWINRNRGEARYVRGPSRYNVLDASQGRAAMTNPDHHIVIQTINGERIARPGDTITIGASWFLRSNGPSPDSPVWSVRNFIIKHGGSDD